MRYQFRPLIWTGPQAAARKSSGVFQAGWEDTLVILQDEIELLDGESPLIFEVDVREQDLRLDGQLKTGCHVGQFPGAAVVFRSKFGQLRYASDAYEQRWPGALPGWQANIRAIALALKALRAVDRYGVGRPGQQYAGYKALAAGNGQSFGSADEALRWMRGQPESGEGGELPPGQLYRKLALRMHPDVKGGSQEDWNRLNNARQLLVTAGLL